MTILEIMNNFSKEDLKEHLWEILDQYYAELFLEENNNCPITKLIMEELKK